MNRHDAREAALAAVQAMVKVRRVDVQDKANQVSCPQAKICLLPDDQLLKIAGLLRLPELRGRLALVNLRFRSLAMSSAALHHSVDVSFLGPGATNGITVVLHALAKLNADGGIRSVQLGNHKWGTTTTRKLLQLFPNLERLDCGDSKKVAGPQLDFSSFALPTAPRLTEFVWSWAYDVPESAVLNLIRGRTGFKALGLSHIERMGDREDHGCTDTLLSQLAQQCPNLRFLQLEGTLRISDSGLRALADGCPQLERVILRAGSPWTIFDHGSPLELYGGVTAASHDFFPADCVLTLEGFPHDRAGVEFYEDEFNNT